MKMTDRLKNFLDDENRLKAFPAKRKMKIQALLYLAGKFAGDKLYTEGEVNDLLSRWHTFDDPATLRRELYNNRLLNRKASGEIYWLEKILPTAEELEGQYQ